MRIDFLPAWPESAFLMHSRAPVGPEPKVSTHWSRSSGRDAEQPSPLAPWCINHRTTSTCAPAIPSTFTPNHRPFWHLARRRLAPLVSLLAVPLPVAPPERKSGLTHGEFRLPRPWLRPEVLTMRLPIQHLYFFIEGSPAKLLSVLESTAQSLRDRSFRSSTT